MQVADIRNALVGATVIIASAVVAFFTLPDPLECAGIRKPVVVPNLPERGDISVRVTGIAPTVRNVEVELRDVDGGTLAIAGSRPVFGMAGFLFRDLNYYGYGVQLRAVAADGSPKILGSTDVVLGSRLAIVDFALRSKDGRSVPYGEGFGPGLVVSR